MKLCSLLFLLIVLFSNVHAQLTTDSVLIEGNYRTFNFNASKGVAARRHLVFILHGSGGDGKGMMKVSENLQALSAKEPILLVYPDGYKKYWNECRKEATSEANKININEQAFFSAMHAYFANNYGAIKEHFFVIGLSGGGHMAYKLAMTMPDQCKAISAIVANLPDTTNLDCAEAKKPVAVMIANGTADDLNPYNGGRMIMSGASWGDVRSTNRSFQYWAQLAGYTGQQPMVQDLPDVDTANKQTITRYTYRQADKPEVTLLEVRGGGHAFPKDLDIFLESWAFFQRELAREGKSRGKK